MKLEAPIESQEFIDAYVNNLPFPHIQINNFLNKEASQELLIALEGETFYEKESDLFNFLQSNDLQSSQNKTIQDFIVTLTNESTLKKIEELTKTKISKKRFDLQASIYQDTDFLLCHDDRLDSRSVAFIYYLTTLEKNEGGALRLYYSKDGKPLSDKYVDLEPKENTLVMFNVSKTSYHEVREVLVNKDRVAIGGWFHVDN